MTNNPGFKSTSVSDPSNMPLAQEGLPNSRNVRWTPRRKAQVVAVVKSGLLSSAEACKKYDMSAEELETWQKAADRGCVRGLRAATAQRDRDIDVSRIEGYVCSNCRSCMEEGPVQMDVR